ncbi:MAG: hypothetical protein PVJ21_00345 [Anaerolineales bacterium]|jgi:hypothetical protein
MAKIQKNSILGGIRGSIGDMVIRQMPDGSVRVSAKSLKKRKFNQAQRDNQDRFKLAQAYAREAKNNPVYLELAQETGRSVYHLALSDGLIPPVIHAIERTDGRVCVIASDNFMVARIWVRILDGEENPLEEGHAAQPDPLHDPERWEYTSHAEGTVEATAWDLAGNRTTQFLVNCEAAREQAHAARFN